MKIRDNETGEVFEYGTNIHHALRISENGGCLTFENLQNGDGSLKSGDGGYSFVLDDGKTPEESTSPDAIHGATYANIGGFREDAAKNDGWIPIEERLPEPYQQVLVSMYNNITYVTIGHYNGYEKKWEAKDWICGWGVDVKAWRPLPEPYRPERSVGE